MDNLGFVWREIKLYVNQRIAEELRRIGIIGQTIQGSHIGGQIPSSTLPAIELDDLDDVDAPAPTDEQVLMYDAASENWIAATVAGVGATVERDLLTNGLEEYPDLIYVNGEVIWVES